MAGKLAHITLNICAALATGFVAHGTNKIDGEPIDSYNREHRNALHNTSLRLAFISLITLYMEDRGLLPDSKEFRDDHGLFGIRLNWNESALSSKKLSFIKRIRRTVERIYNDNGDFAPFRARLFDPSEKSNKYIFEWKIYDVALKDSVNDLFNYIPHPGTGLMSWNPPDLNEIVDVYSELLDAELCVADCESIFDIHRGKLIPLDEAHPGEIRHGRTIPQGGVYYIFEKRKSRRSGTVYTSEDIIERIIKRTIDPIIDDPSPDKPLRIFDPACGTGKFLKAALDHLMNRSSIKPEDHQVRRKILSKSIFGFDHDDIAISLAEISLMLETHRIDDPAPALRENLIVSDCLTGIDSKFIREMLRQGGVIKEEFDESQGMIDDLKWNQMWKNMQSGENNREKIQCLSRLYSIFVDYLRNSNTDFKKVSDMFRNKFSRLIEGHIEYGFDEIKCTHPEICYPALFYDPVGRRRENAGFDAVIGNPPYGDILDSDTKSLLIKLGYKSGGSGNNDIFRFFVERGLKLLRPGGMLGFIIPNTFLKGRKYMNFRHRVLELSHVEEVVDFDHAKKFDREVFTALLFLRKKPCARAESLYITVNSGTLEKEKMERFNPDLGVDDSWIPPGEIYSRLSDDDRFKTLDPYFARVGDVGINYQRKSVGWTCREKSGIAQRILYEGDRHHEDDLPYLKGEDVERFVVKPKVDRWLRHDWREQLSDGEVVNVNYEWGRHPVKILSRQTGDSIIAAVDTKLYLTGRSLHTSIIRDLNYSPWYIIALMNSSVLTEVYRELTREKGRPQAQVKLSFLRKLPIRKIDFSMNNLEREQLFEDLIEVVDSNPGKLCEIVFELKESEKQSVIHDLIADISKRIETNVNGNGHKCNDALTLQAELNKSIEILYECE